jgi:hypothetical protein
MLNKRHSRHGTCLRADRGAPAQMEPSFLQGSGPKSCAQKASPNSMMFIETGGATMLFE